MSAIVKKRSHGIFAVVVIIAILFAWQWRGGETDDLVCANEESPKESVSKSDTELVDEHALIDEVLSIHTWMARWESASGDIAEQKRVLAEASIEQARVEVLMKKNPQQALAAALPLRDWVRLPEELQAYFPRPFSGVGDIDQLWAVTESHSHGAGDGACDSCQGYNEVAMGGEKFTAHGVVGGHLPVLVNAPLAGVRVGRTLLIDESPVVRLEAADVNAAKSLYPASFGDRDPVSGNAIIPTAMPVLIAGEVVLINDADDLVSAEEALIAAREEAKEARSQIIENPVRWLDAIGGSGSGSNEGVATTPYMTNNIRVLFIRVDFSDFPGAPVSKSNLEATLSTVAGHIDDYSYGAAKIDFTVSNSVYRMPRTGASYATDSGIGGDGIDGNDSLHAAASAAAAANYVLGNFDVVAVYFPDLRSVQNSLMTYGGLASIGGAQQWINGANNVSVVLHEFGHNYGLYHANYYDPSEATTGDYQVPGSAEFGDIFDVMGNGLASDSHFSHLAKNYLGWLPDSKVAEAAADNTYRIYRFDHINAITNNLLAVKVPVSGNVDYWIGYRQLNTASTNNLDSSAYVVASNLSRNRETNLIDMTPDSDGNPNLDRRDAGLPLNNPLVVGGGAVTIEAVARGGIEPNQWIDVRVEFATRVGFAQSVVEVDERQTMVLLDISREFGSSGEVAVSYATSSAGGAGSATPGTDYCASSGIVVWADGEMGTKRISIPIHPDALAEGVEEFVVTLSNSVGAALDSTLDEMTVRILDPGERYVTFDQRVFGQTVNAIVPLSDDKVIIGGNIASGIGGEASIRHIARLSQDGSVDTSFVSGTGFDGEVNGIVRQADGKLIVVGAFQNYNGRACNRVVRLDAEGGIDNTFRDNIGTGANGTVNVVEVEADGWILLGGAFTSFDGAPCQGMIRLRPSGIRATVLNTPFQTNFNAEVHDILALENGDMIVTGSFYNPSNGGLQGGCMRLNNTGSRDSGFNTGGGARDGGPSGFIGRIYSVSRDLDGSGYLLAGSFDTFDGNAVDGLVRVSSSGLYDATFNTPAYGTNPRVVLRQASGKVLVGGRFSSPKKAIQRLMGTGAVDSTFVVGGGLTYDDGSAGFVSVLVEDDYGAVWVGGNFFNYRGVDSAPVIRLAGGSENALDKNYAIDAGYDPLAVLTWIGNAGEITITDCNTAATGSLVIPPMIDGKPVTVIGDAAFQDCSSLTSVTIPSSVTDIGNDAFYRCSSLTSVFFIGSAPTSVGSNAFDDLAAGAKALVYFSNMDSFGTSGSAWKALILEARPDPFPSVRFIRPSYNAAVWRRGVTRYRVMNPELASRMEVMVRGRGAIRWLSYNDVESQHLLDRKIVERPRSRFLNTWERARVRDKSGRIVQVTSRKFRSKFPWNNRRAKINVLRRF